uniref:Uncharacterized protein n=1 Tax=Setaria digitata TaxID=48799 RepID=A0A915Q4E6_9BILA
MCGTKLQGDGGLCATMLPKLSLVLFGFLNVGVMGVQYSKIMDQQKNEPPLLEWRPIVQKPLVAQKGKEIEENAQDVALRMPSVLDKNHVTAGWHLAHFEWKNPYRKARIQKPSPLDTLKAVSLLALLHSISSGDHFQPGIRRRIEGYYKDALANTRNKMDTNLQKQVNITDNFNHNSSRWDLNVDDTSKTNDFNLGLMKLTEESANSVLRRNPRYSYLSNPLSLVYAADDFGAEMDFNINSKVEKQLKINETMNMEDSAKFISDLDFRKFQKLASTKSKQERYREDHVSVKNFTTGSPTEKHSTTNSGREELSESTTASKIENVHDQAVLLARNTDQFETKVPSKNSEAEKVSEANFLSLSLAQEKSTINKENIEQSTVIPNNGQGGNLRLRTSESLLRPNYDGNSDHDNIREVSILTIGAEERIIYARQSNEEHEELEMYEDYQESDQFSDIQDNSEAESPKTWFKMRKAEAILDDESNNSNEHIFKVS